MHFIRIRNTVINLDNVNHIARTKKCIDIVFANNDWLGLEVGVNITQKDYTDILAYLRKFIPVEADLEGVGEEDEKAITPIEKKEATVEEKKNSDTYKYGNGKGERQ